MRQLTYLIAFALSLLLWLPATSLALKQGEPLPEMTGYTLDDEAFNLSSLKGQPFILKIGTTWCPTCGEQTDEINKIREYLDAEGIAYVEVFVREKAGRVRKYFSDKGHPLPDTVLLDRGEMARTLNIYLIPRVILVDRHLRIYRDADPQPARALKKALAAMLTEN